MEQNGIILHRKICLTPCNLPEKAFFHFPMHTFHPFLQILEIKIHFFHIYTPFLLYNMHIRRLNQYNLCTLGNVPIIEKWCQVSMSRKDINDPWPSIYWKHSQLSPSVPLEGYKWANSKLWKRGERIQL
jgi:hypothetical protein